MSLCVVFVVYRVVLHGLCGCYCWLTCLCVFMCCVIVCVVRGYCVMLNGSCVLHGVSVCVACVRVICL